MKRLGSLRYASSSGDRREPPQAMSAHGREFDWRAKAREAGCLDCLNKPMSFEKLTGILERLAAS